MTLLPGGACPVLVCSACSSVAFIFRCTELTEGKSLDFSTLMLCAVVSLEMEFLRDETMAECSVGTDTAES